MARVNSLGTGGVDIRFSVESFLINLYIPLVFVVRIIINKYRSLNFVLCKNTEYSQCLVVHMTYLHV